MKTGNRFWWVLLAALLGAAVTFAAGCWQLRRAAAKEAVAAAIASRHQMPVVGTDELLATRDPLTLVHRQARLQGHWLADRTVYLDNRPMDGQSGFYVLTPLQLGGAGSPVVVVQRGWVPRDPADRTRLPRVEPDDGPVVVQGILAPPPSRLYELERLSGRAPAEEGAIRQNLDLARFAQSSGLSVLGLSLQQAGPAKDGLRRHWPAPGTGVEKHYGYATQWFAMCALIVGLFVWFQLIAPYVRSRSESSPR